MTEESTLLMLITYRAYHQSIAWHVLLITEPYPSVSANVHVIGSPYCE
jgi:hypothetical protein